MYFAIAGRWLRGAVRTILAGMCFAGFSGRALAVDLIGYVPYYSMGGTYLSSTLPNQLPLLDEVRYFGLTVDSTGQIVPLAGSGDLQSHLDRIAQLKSMIDGLPAAQRPRLDITLGGAGEAAAFSTIAASSSLRQTLAQNIKSHLTASGGVSVDIDWEHPANTTTELGNYSLMVQRIKQEVGATVGVHTAMTPELFMPPSAFQGANAIDGVSLMTYDLGYWGNDPDNPNAGEHSLQHYVEESVDAWTKPSESTIPADVDWYFSRWGNDTAASHLGVGLPMYGRDIADADFAVSYSDLKTGGWSTSDGNYYTKSGRTVWIPGPALAEQRVEFAKDAGLKNIIIWSLNNDLDPTNPASLLRHAFDANQSAVAIQGDYDASGSVGTSDYQLWRSRFGATTGDMRADGNQNGIIDAGGYAIWRKRQTTSGFGTSESVPEPSCVALLVVFSSLLAFRPRG